MEEKQNLFSKFINFIKSIFKKEEAKQIPQKTSKTVNDIEKSEFVNEIKLQNYEDSEILKIQEQYENGRLELASLTDEQVHALKLLYEKQISDLEKKLEENKTELNIAKYRIKNYSASN